MQKSKERVQLEIPEEAESLKIKKVKVLQPKSQQLNQMSNSLEMFLVQVINEEFIPLHAFMMCKDYIQDIYYAEYTGNPVEKIYNFSWKKGENKYLNIEDPYQYVCIRNSQYSRDKFGYTEELCTRIRDFLSDFCTRIKMSTPEVYLANESEGVVIKFDTKITKVPYLLSLFLSLCRLSHCVQKLDDIFSASTMNYSYTDGSYIQSTKLLIDQQMTVMVTLVM